MGRIVWKSDRRPQVQARMRRATADAIEDAAEFLLEQANRSVPLQDGILQGSGKVTTRGGGKVGAAVSYDTPYAVRQHEDTRLAHAPGRRAKWLQRTLNEERRRILDFIASKIKGSL
jgi:hypothetical protein